MTWLSLLGGAVLLGLLLAWPLAVLGSKGPLRRSSRGRKQRSRGLPPAGATHAAAVTALLRQHEGPCQLPTLLSLLRQQWQELGLGPRTLRDSELAALALRAGFSGGLRPGQPPLSSAALQRFVAWLAPQLAVLQAVGPGVYACPTAQLLCGFDVDRCEAEAALAQHRPGTFCLRLSSMPGHLVISLREAPDAGRRRGSTDVGASSGGSGSYGPSSGSEDQPNVSHYLFPADRLRLTGLSRALAEVPGCLRLLDVRSGRTHRPSILRKAAAAPNTAAAWPLSA